MSAGQPIVVDVGIQSLMPLCVSFSKLSISFAENLYNEACVVLDNGQDSRVPSGMGSMLVLLAKETREERRKREIQKLSFCYFFLFFFQQMFHGKQHCCTALQRAHAVPVSTSPLANSVCSVFISSLSPICIQTWRSAIHIHIIKYYSIWSQSFFLFCCLLSLVL